MKINQTPLPPTNLSEASPTRMDESHPLQTATPPAKDEARETAEKSLLPRAPIGDSVAANIVKMTLDANAAMLDNVAINQPLQHTDQKPQGISFSNMPIEDAVTLTMMDVAKSAQDDLRDMLANMGASQARKREAVDYQAAAATTQNDTSTTSADSANDPARDGFSPIHRKKVGL